MSAPRIRGWCPSAYRPMMSGDGLLVRVRPRLSRLSDKDLYGLCDLSERHGNGMIDITSRLNLQIRGVSDASHPEVLASLIAMGLVDADPGIEARRSVVLAPHWQPDDPGHRLASELAGRLGDLPELPDKMGVAIDVGHKPMLRGVAADFRFEAGETTPLILRPDTADRGVPVDHDCVFDALMAMADWFLETGGSKRGRMGRHLERTPLPETCIAPMSTQPRHDIQPGPCQMGFVIAVPFGQVTATEIRRLLDETSVRNVRLVPGRMLLLEGVDSVDLPGFITVAGDPLLRVAACPGAPACSQASVETRALARRLAGRFEEDLHVSGCAKGCASPRPAALTIVGRDGRFDVIERGLASDTPIRTGLSETALEEHLS